MCRKLAAEGCLDVALGDPVNQAAEAFLAGVDPLADKRFDGLVDHRLFGGNGSFRSTFALGLALHVVL